MFSLEEAVKQAREEASQAKTTERGYAQQLKGLSATNEQFLSQLQGLEQQLTQAAAKEEARKKKEAKVKAEAEVVRLAEEEARNAKVPPGWVRLTVCVKSQSDDDDDDEEKGHDDSDTAKPSPSSSSASTATAMATMSTTTTRRFVYVCDGQLPVSWLLSQV